MDNQDKLLKDILSGSLNENVPLSFMAGITRKIEKEKAIREKKLSIRESAYQFFIFLLILSLFISLFAYISINYFDINFDFKISLPEDNFFRLKETGIRLKNLFLNPESLVWYIVGLNMAVLFIAQQLIQRRVK